MSANLQGIGMTSQRTRDRLIQRLQEQNIQDLRVLEVIRNTPRHIFVDEALASRAYEDTALPIGHGQTISQPYTVARMTEILLVDDIPKKVLEVGTGSGYQTAVLAQLVDEVFSVERIAPLLASARKRFRTLKLTNVRCKHSDGNWGWQERAPFDAIMVTAATEEAPAELARQLAEGGRMIIPLGRHDSQRLCLITRTGEEYTQQELEWVSFVPLLGGEV